MDNRELLQAFYREMECQIKTGKSSLAPLLHSEFELHMPQTVASSPVTGVAGLTDFLDRDVCDVYDVQSLQFSFSYVMADADYAHTLYSLSAVTRIGRDYRNDYLATLQIDRGLIRQCWEFFDTAYLYRQAYEG